MTKLNKTALKEIAINYLTELKVCPKAVRALSIYDNVSVFGSCVNIFADPYVVTPVSELARRIAVAEKNGAKVFAITRDFLPDYGCFYSFLLVSPYEEDWDETFKAVGDNTYRVYAYVWNVNDDKCSEFGSVYIKAENGGLLRVG